MVTPQETTMSKEDLETFQKQQKNWKRNHRARNRTH